MTRKEDPSDEAVEDDGEEEGEDVEGEEVYKVVVDVLLAGELEGAFLNVLEPTVGDGDEFGESEPGGTVDDGKDPNSEDDPFGPVHGAHGLSLHGMADRNVPLDRKGREGERGGVDSEVLEKTKDRTPPLAPNPLVPNDIVENEFIGDRGGEDDNVCEGEAYKVAVCGGVHGLGFGHHKDHEDISEEAHEEDYPLEDRPNDSIGVRVVLGVIEFLKWVFTAVLGQECRVSQVLGEEGRNRTPRQTTTTQVQEERNVETKFFHFGVQSGVLREIQLLVNVRESEIKIPEPPNNKPFSGNED